MAEELELEPVDDIRASIASAMTDEPEAEASATVPVDEAAEDPFKEPAADKPRDPDGKFAKKGDEPVDAPKPAPQHKAEETVIEAEKPVEAAPDAQNGVAPPPGWSVQAKQAFHELPDAVKQAVAQRETEINNGFAKLQEFKALEPYAQQAQQSGKQLPEVLDAYIAAENYLESDPVNGVKWLMTQYGVTPEQLGAVQSEGDQNPVNAALDPIVQELNALKRTVLTQQHTAQQQTITEAQSQIDAFAADPAHPYFENVKQSMGALINAGQAADLKDAYEKACWLNPDIRAETINREAEAANQKRQQEAEAARSKAEQAAKSVAGDPGGDYSPSSSPKSTLRDELAAQMGAARA